MPPKDGGIMGVNSVICPLDVLFLFNYKLDNNRTTSGQLSVHGFVQQHLMTGGWFHSSIIPLILR